MIFLHTTCLEDFFQTIATEGTHTAALIIILNSFKQRAGVILSATGKVFQTILIFNGDNNSAIFFQVFLQNSQKILISMVEVVGHIRCHCVGCGVRAGMAVHDAVKGDEI